MAQSYCGQEGVEFHHVMPVQIRFNDIDMIGHINNNVYLTYMDLAKVRYFQAVYGPDLSLQEIGIVVVNINANFCQPSFIDDQLEVVSAVVSVGEKSLVLEQAVRSSVDGSVRCSCRTVMVGFDPKTNTSFELPADRVEPIEKFEGRKLRR